MNRIPVRLSILTLTTALAALVLPGSAQAAPYCGITWGSLAKSSSGSDVETLNGVRTGRHACYDRLVVDLGGGDRSFDSYDVSYVPVVHSEAKGDPIPVRGAADLQVIVRAPAYDLSGNPTFIPSNPSEVADVSGYTTFRQLAWGDSFEGQTTLALGVRARLPFRVFTLDATSTSGPRLVIDVAHRW